MSSDPPPQGGQVYSKTRAAEDPFSRTEASLLLLLTAVVCGTILFLGGHHPWGATLYVVGMPTIAALWCLRGLIDRSVLPVSFPAWPIFLAGLGLAGLQIIPLPDFLLNGLSPARTTRLSEWATGGQFGRWSTVSLFPAGTRRAITMGLAHCSLWFVLADAISNRSRRTRFLQVIGGMTVGVAAIALLQFLSGTDRYLWVYDHPFAAPVGECAGPFVNPNHLGHFLAIGLAPVFALAFLGSSSSATSKKPRRNPDTNSTNSHGWQSSSPSVSPRDFSTGWVIGFAMIALAGLLTFSRGGVLALGVALTICVATSRRNVSHRSRWVLGGCGVLMIVLLGIFGASKLGQQLGTLTDSEGKALHSRQAIWSAVGAVIQEHPLVGTGLGSHRHVHLTHLPPQNGLWYFHAESSILQLIEETGAIGLSVLLFALATASFGVFRLFRSSHRKNRVFGAIAASVLVVSVLHAGFDAVWLMPGTLAPVLAILAVALSPHASRSVGRKAELSPEPNRGWFHRPAVALATIGFVSASIFGGSTSLPQAAAARPWAEYHRHQRDYAGHPLTDDVLEARIALLSEIVDHDPQDPHAQLRLARLRVAQLDSALSAQLGLSLGDLRDTLRDFQSSEDRQDWLANILSAELRSTIDQIGNGAKAAVRSCPCCGDGYVFLHSMAPLFEESKHRDSEDVSLLRQALLTRPYSGLVQVALAEEFEARGNKPAALKCWAKAYRFDLSYRETIRRQVAPHLPVKEYLTLFQPPLADSERLVALYRETGQRANEKIALRYAAFRYLEKADSLKAPSDRSRYLRHAATLERTAGNADEAITILNRAITLTPSSVPVRAERAATWLQLSRFDLAIEDLTWCRRREPDVPRWRTMLQQAQRASRQLPTTPKLASEADREKTLTRTAEARPRLRPISEVRPIPGGSVTQSPHGPAQRGRGDSAIDFREITPQQ